MEPLGKDMWKMVLYKSQILYNDKNTQILFLDADSPHNFKKLRSDVRKITINEKNPISVLNELRYGLKYEIVEQSGPPHNPTFKVRVKVDGQMYYGVGNSKKGAKCEAANAALKSFIQFPNSHMIISANQNSISVNRVDFTSDQISNKDNKNLPKGSNKNKLTKGPLMMLNELYPNAEYACLTNDLDPFARFKVIVKIGEETFQGTGY